MTLLALRCVLGNLLWLARDASGQQVMGFSDRQFHLKKTISMNLHEFIIKKHGHGDLTINTWGFAKC